MNKLLESIFQTGKFETSNNELVAVHSETKKEQCLYLQNIISTNKFSKSLEIGFAFGTSTLAIMEKILNNNGKCVVIDKYEISDWKGYGIDLIKQAAYYNKLEFYEDLSYNVLPVFSLKKRSFDFVYVDSTKLFDYLLVDFFYIDKILDINGIIVFDDLQYKSIRKLFRFLSQLPNYKVYSQFPVNKPLSNKQKLLQLLRILPLSQKFLKEDIISTDYELGINTHCLALVKIKDDDRNWNWHINF